MVDPKRVIEAALFAAGGPVSLDALREITGQSRQAVNKFLGELAEDYRGSALEIVNIGGEKHLMQAMPKYSEYIAAIAPREFDAPTVRTLSVIAYNQPIKQSEIVEMRGNKAYDHIKFLIDRGIVKGKKHGHTKILRTTDAFAEYFSLSSNEPELIRKEFKKSE